MSIRSKLLFLALLLFSLPAIAQVASYSGNGSPEGHVSAKAGSIYLDASSGTHYFKGQGEGATGWVQQVGTVPVTEDPTNFIFKVGHLPVVSDLHVASQASGTLPNGTYGYCLVTVNANGFWPDYSEGNYVSGITKCSNIVYATVTSSANATINLGWTVLPALGQMGWSPYLSLERCTGVGCGSNLTNFGFLNSTFTPTNNSGLPYVPTGTYDDGTNGSPDTAEPPPATDTSFIAAITGSGNPDNPGYMEFDCGTGPAGSCELNGFAVTISQLQVGSNYVIANPFCDGNLTNAYLILFTSMSCNPAGATWLQNPNGILLTGGGVLIGNNGGDGSPVIPSVGLALGPIFTVGTLPAANSVPAGTIEPVSDAMTFTVGTCTGGGSDYMLAISNGSTWSCH